VQSRLNRLGPYPFERLKGLLEGRTPNPRLAGIDAGAGEPRLPLPRFVMETLQANSSGFSRYPPTRGIETLRCAVAEWLMRRYGLDGIDPDTQVLAANGTREALFAVAHAMIDPEADPKSWVLMPNPMYQIYLGAAITSGAEPCFLPCLAEHDFEPELGRIPDSVWERTVLVYVCSPSNPTGWVATKAYYVELLRLADRYDFVICADECYSEIYMDAAPTGLLEAARQLGRSGFERCLVFNSLSKRSAMPGLRSGFIAGDARLIRQFAKLRSYTGPATPSPLQMVAAEAWRDEEHVRSNRQGFRQSLRAFYDAYGQDRIGKIPDGGFFVWLPVKDDEVFAAAAYEQQAITILPGRYLSAEDDAGNNPGRGFVRIALLDGPEKATELARRLMAVRLNYS